MTYYYHLHLIFSIFFPHEEIVNPQYKKKIKQCDEIINNPYFPQERKEEFAKTFSRFEAEIKSKSQASKKSFIYLTHSH